MRILILIKGLGRGGAEQLLVNTTPYLDRSRFEYEVAYLLPSKKALLGDLKKAGLAVRCLGESNGFGWVRGLRAAVSSRGISLVHAHLPYPAIGARLGVGSKTRLVYTEHNVWSRYRRSTYWANLLTFRRNDHVFAVSDQVRQSIQYPRGLGFLGLPPIETLYYGLDLAATDRWSGVDGVRNELGIPAEAPLVGAVGNLKPHKGQEYLLRAAALIRERVPRARFVLVGIGPREKELRREAEALGIQHLVTFAGLRADAPRIAAALDVFVQPSEAEGLPIALLEAMAARRAVVATRVGGTPEVVDDGANGLLVPPRDPAAIAASVVSLLEDPDRRRVLGEAAGRRAREFDIRTAVARMEQVYDQLLA